MDGYVADTEHEIPVKHSGRESHGRKVRWVLGVEHRTRGREMIAKWHDLRNRYVSAGVEGCDSDPALSVCALPSSNLVEHAQVKYFGK